MSILTLYLNRIMQWLEKNRPDYGASFLPGLSDAEIRKKLANVELELPEEIYELYRWKNGVEDGEDFKSLVPSIEFVDLDKAVEYYRNFREKPVKVFCKEDYQNVFEKLDDKQLNIYGNYRQLFPFSCFNGRHYYAVLLSKKQQQHSPIIDISFHLELKSIYRNLMTMMQTIAEYLETGTHYLDNDGFLDGDEEKMLPIFQKYNPGFDLIV
ncbi:MAG: hypothetical protein AAF757_19205 [Cyanobacteria bacterium P01_D01_bin.116]